MASEQFRAFVGGLSWDTTDRGLEAAFRPYGKIVEAKVVLDRETGRSRGFGFVTFDEEDGLESAIKKMHSQELDGRTITVSKAQPPRDRGERGERGGGGGGGGGGGAGGGECFKCGDRGHWARDCPNGGGGGGGGGGRRERYGSDRYGGGGGGGDRYESGGDKYGGDSGRGGGGRYGDRGGGGGDRYGGGSRDNGNGRSRSGPYDRPSRSRYD